MSFVRHDAISDDRRFEYASAGELWRIYLRRLRRLTLQEAVHALVPTRYDTLLYQGDRESLDAVPTPTTPLPVVVKRYDRTTPKSGLPDIDNRIRGRLEGYVALVNGVLAHRCFVTWACPRLWQFGLDPTAPLLIEGYTEPAFRRNHLQAFMRRYIVEDILSRGIVDKVYNEIRPDNFISQKGNERGGLRPVVRLQGIKVLGTVFRRRVIPITR